MSRWTWCRTALLLLSGLPHSSLAQEAAPPVDESALDVLELPPVEVRPEPAAPVTSATRRDPTGALSVVEVGERSGEARDTAGLLTEVPGLLIQQLGGYGQSQSVSMRGASSNGVLVLLDGIPLNGAGGLVDLSRLPVAWLSRLEVLRGGAGAAYGSGALGGAVNLVTRELTRAPSATLEFGAGSFGTYQGNASLAGPLLGGEGLVLLHAGRSAGDFPYLHDATPSWDGDTPELRRRENNDAALGGGLVRFRRPLVGALSLEALGVLTFDDRGLAGTELNPTPTVRESHRRATAALGLVHAAPGAPELSARTWFRSDAGVLERYGRIEQHHAALGVELDGGFLLGRAHLLSVHASFAREWFDAGAQAVVRHQGALSVMDAWEPWTFLSVVPSVRVDRVGEDTLFSPKLGLAVRLPLSLEVRANAGQSHRAPSFLELFVQQGGLAPNPALLPERSRSADLGLAYASRALEVSVTAFQAHYENLISYEFYPPGLPRPYNFGAAEVQGLETALRAHPWPWLSASGSWTWLHSRNLMDDVRYRLKALPYRPTHRGVFRVEGGPAWLRAHVQLEAQSAQFIDRTETGTLEPRALVHAGLTAQLGPQAHAFRLSLEARNLGDARVHDFNGYPLPGRSFHLTVGGAWEAAPSTPHAVEAEE